MDLKNKHILAAYSGVGEEEGGDAVVSLVVALPGKLFLGRVGLSADKQLDTTSYGGVALDNLLCAALKARYGIDRIAALEEKLAESQMREAELRQELEGYREARKALRYAVWEVCDSYTKSNASRALLDLAKLCEYTW